MKNPFAWLAREITTRPLAVAGAAVIVFLVMLYGVSQLTMETGTGTYLDKNTPRGALLAHYTDTYGSDALMLIFETNDIRDAGTLDYIDMLQADIRNEQSVERVSGIVDLLKQGNGGTLPGSTAEVEQIISRSPPEVVNRYMPSRMMTISVVTLQPGLSNRRQEEILNSIRTLVKLSNPPPGTTVIISGQAAFSQEMQAAMGSSMAVLILAAMLLMVLAVLALFSHVRYPLLSVLVVGSGLILTFGFMGLANIPISMVVIGAFPVLIGIGIDYAIQMHSRLDEEIRRSTLKEAVTTTITKTGPAVLVAMLATSMGFIAMILGPIPMVGDFGITCTIGVMSCYLAALVIIPVFAVLMEYRSRDQAGTPAGTGEPAPEDRKEVPVHPAGPNSSFIERYDAILGNIAYTVAKHPVPILLLVFLVAAVGFQLDNEVPISADEKTFVPSDMPALVDMNKVTRTMGAASTIPLVVSGENVLDPLTLAWIRDFGEYEVTRNDKITGVTSIATLLSQYNNGVLPATESEVEETLSRIPAETKKRYLNGRMETVLEFSTVDMEMSQARSQIAVLRKDVGWVTPPVGDTARITGSLEMFSTLMDDISNSKTLMTVLGFAMILGFLVIVYRRVHAATPLIPIVAIVGWNGGIMYLLGLDYTPLTAVLGSMTIGVASEYTILIMERVDEELARGLDLLSAIGTSVQKIGTAITVSGMTTVFGFAALTLSEFNIISNFGITTVITVGFSLAGAIVIMPAVISLMYRSEGFFVLTRKEKSSGEIPVPE
ncbi:MAG: hydrophobe/amphiphile efflux-3 (HAE3) family transporter [Methanoregula sp.]|nr:hydrophobe/amphiphile efflux-3 (HAE3) family transporter [Methanoregula sp.]